MAWIRKVGAFEELVFASDSRLRSGQAWDGCPKILTLARGDCLIAFAGDTMSAYPLMLQFKNWVELDTRARRRERDITEIKKRMRLMFMEMWEHISDPYAGASLPDPYDCELLFGGWSWKSNKFCLWRFHWEESKSTFDFQPVGSFVKVGKNHPMMFAGNRDAIETARDRIIELLRKRKKFRTDYFDMEPFEALVEIIREEKFDDVGGPPQIAKAYRNGNTQAFAVKWDTKPGSTLSVLGRPLFKGEKVTVPAIDPDDIEFRNIKTIRKRNSKKDIEQK